MKAKILDTKDRTKAYNELKAHHKERMEFLTENAGLEQRKELLVVELECIQCNDVTIGMLGFPIELNETEAECQRLTELKKELQDKKDRFDLRNPTLLFDRVCSSFLHIYPSLLIGTALPCDVQRGELSRQPPAVARILLLVATRNISHANYILDCFHALNDLMSPDFPAATVMCNVMTPSSIQLTCGIDTGSRNLHRLWVENF